MITDVSWTVLALPIAIALALIVLPGLLIALAAGLRGFIAVGVAPALSVTCLGFGAVLAGFAGLPWGWWIPAGTAVALAAGTWIVCRVGRQTRGKGRPTPRHSNLRARHNYRVLEWTSWAGLAGAVLLMGRHFKNVIGTPEAFSQTFDNIFHLSAIRYVAETGNASSLTIASLTSGGQPPGFYPAAFHDLASLVFMSGTAPITVAVNASLFALTAVAWPLSCLALVRLALPPRVAIIVGAAVLAASLPAFPVLLLNFGVLYPNLMGLAVLPVSYALIVRILKLGPPGGPTPGTALVLFAQAGVGLALAHPNAVMALLAIAVAPALAFWVPRALKAARGRQWLVLAGWAVTLVGFVAVAYLMWRFIRPPDGAATWLPILSEPQAAGEALLNGPMGTMAAWAPSIVMWVGLAWAVRGRHWWLAGSWLSIAALWIIVASWPFSADRTFWTGIWYNDSWRLAAMFPLLAVPLGAVGFDHLATRLTLAVKKAGLTRTVRYTPALRVVTAALLGVMILLTQRAPYMNENVERAAANYEITAYSPLVNSDEYALLMRITTQVPADTVIATNPWNGSSMAYALTGVRTTTTHTLYTPTPDVETVNAELDEMTSDAEACAAVERLGITHALDFGDQEVNHGVHPLPGFDRLSSSPGFRLIDRQGSAALYELTSCQVR